MSNGTEKVKETQEKTYINILNDSLVKKAEIVKSLLEIIIRQDKCLSSQTVDMDEFRKLMDEKEPFIQQLEQLDSGFDQVYQKVRQELEVNKQFYQLEILQMQDHIARLTEISVMLQKKELDIRNKMEIFLSKKKTEIKNFKMSNKTVSNYYKNIGGVPQGEAYFINKQK